MRDWAALLTDDERAAYDKKGMDFNYRIETDILDRRKEALRLDVDALLTQAAQLPADNQAALISSVQDQIEKLAAAQPARQV